LLQVKAFLEVGGLERVGLAQGGGGGGDIAVAETGKSFTVIPHNT